MATLYDYAGRPVKSSPLQQERSAGSLTSVRTPYESTVAFGLTPEKLVSILNRAREGDHEDYLTLAHEMEQRDAHYMAILGVRKMAVAGLKFEVTPVNDNNAQDVKEAEAVASILKAQAFGESIIDVLDGLGKGFSVTELVWARSAEMWKPVEYHHRPARWFFFERETLRTLRLHDGSVDGQELEAFKYICHKPKIVSGVPIAGGLARVVMALHLFSSFALRDWAAYSEICGIPVRVGRYADGATEADIEALKDAVRNIGSDAAAVIKNTMEIVFERAANSGGFGADKFFETFLAFLDKLKSKAVLGQTMTVEDGSSMAQAKVHDEVRDDIRNADAVQCRNTIRRDVIKPIVDLNFGARQDEHEYPNFEFDIEEPEDLELLAKALVPFITLGLPVSKRVILEKFGLPEPEPGEDLLTAPVPVEPGSEDEEKKDKKSDEEKKAKAKLAQVLEGLQNTTNLRAFKAELKEKGIL
jgi:phage gp29-like protein